MLPLQRLAIRAAVTAACIAAASLAAAAGPAAPAVQFIQSDAAKAAGFPFSEAVQVGGLLLLSGQIGFDSKVGKLVAGGIEPEARRTMDNIKALLASRGLGMDAVVKCTVMLADMADWPAFNAVYRTYFEDGRFPARSAFGASGLALGARVEVECIAAVGG